jgi:hypothetical protein
MYTQGIVSLVTLRRDIRNCLVIDKSFDLDIVNAHPSIFLNLCREHDWNCPNLERYVDHRSDVLKEMMEMCDCSYQQAKDNMRILTYLGPTPMSKTEGYNFATDYRNEMQCLGTKITEEYPEAFTLALNKKIKFTNGIEEIIKSRNKPVATCLHYVLTTVERHCMFAVIHCLEDNGREVESIIYDGALIKRNNEEDIFPSDLIEKAEEAITEHTGYDIKLAVKSIETSFVFEDEDSVVFDDDHAAHVLVNLVGKDNFVMVGEKILVFDTKTGLWSDKVKILKRLIHSHKKDLIFKTATSVKNYGGNTSLIDKLIKCIPIYVEDSDDFWEDNIDSSIGHILFDDGIYNMTTGVFTQGFDPKIVFAGSIGRPFNHNVNQEDIDLVETILFNDSFTTDQIEQKVPMFSKIAIARGLFGDYRARLSYFYLGNTGTGKGVVVEGVTKACGTYVGTFAIKAMQLQPNSSTDAAKQLSFTSPIKYKRLSFSNEPPRGIKLDGNLFKLVVSGGDGMVIRQNYEDEHTIRNRCTLFVMGNDMPDISPTDDAVIDRIGGVVSYNIKFVEKTTGFKLDEEKKRNSLVKDLFNKSKYQDALLHILFDAYQYFLKNGHHKPDNVIEATKEWVVDDNSIEAMLSEKFIITKNEEDYIQFHEIKKYLIDDKKLAMTNNKLGRELTSIGLFSKEIKIDKKNCTCRTGIKKYPEPVVTYEW